MSNPVAPPPPASEDGLPPPAAPPGTGDAPAQPGFPPPSAAEQGFGAAPAPGQQGIGDAPAAPPVKKKSAVGRIVLRVGATLVALVIVLVVKDVFFGDKAKDAAIGDCIASSKKVTGTASTEAEAKVVDCGSGDAAFTVVGRIDGETDTNSKSCDKYFKENEEFFVYSSTASGGYLLCLKPKA